LEWKENTIANVYSATKGVTNACIALLVDRGLLSYHERISKFWKGFEKFGKEDITVEQLLSHQVDFAPFFYSLILPLLGWIECI